MANKVGFKEITMAIVVVFVGFYIASPSTAISGVIVKASDYGEAWPLKVAEAHIDCDVPDIAYVEANGTRYALNGGALRSGLPRPDAIRKDSVSILMADFTEKAMQICLDKRK
jgi:Protein of unknown function (DUF2511)